MCIAREPERRGECRLRSLADMEPRPLMDMLMQPSGKFLESEDPSQLIIPFRALVL